MRTYDYPYEMKGDIEDYIRVNITVSNFADREELENYLNEVLWVEDSVTGNASGSYYCNAYAAQEALVGNLDLLAEAVEEFCCDIKTLFLNPEACDVTIRCYLLSQVISEVLDELYDLIEMEENENE